MSLLCPSSHLTPDINECMQTPDICGLGTCSNNDNGMFYECTCQDGATTIGNSSDGTLMCVGRWTFCSATACT